MGQPRPLFVYFRSLDTNIITIFTRNISEKMFIQFTVPGFEPTTLGTSTSTSNVFLQVIRRFLQQPEIDQVWHEGDPVSTDPWKRLCWRWIILKTNLTCSRAVVVAQLVEPLLPIQEVCGLNPVIGKIYIEHLFTVNCIEKTKIKKKEASRNCNFLKNWTS